MGTYRSTNYGKETRASKHYTILTLDPALFKYLAALTSTPTIVSRQ